MNRANRFDQRLETGLAELADPHFPDYFDDVLAVTGRSRQRPAWTFPGRWLPMADIARRRAFVPVLPWRTIGVLIALLLIAALAAVIVGSRPRVPAPFGPAANGLIAYDSGGDVYIGDPITGVSRAVLTGPGDDFDPAWSRDGTLLAISRPANGRDSTWVVRPDGSHLVEVTPKGGVEGMTFWDWGPDSSSIYYVGLVDGVSRLFAAATDGSGARLIAPDLRIDSFWFRPPDGRELVVRSQLPMNVELLTMAADGTQPHTLVAPDSTPIEEHDMAIPRWSPDGTRVAYQHWDRPFENMQLHVIDADGRNDKVLHWGSATFEGWPVWSLDSKRLVIQRAFPTATEHLGFGHPFAIVNADGTGQPVEISPPLDGGAAHAEFSPDGTKVLMRTIESGTQLILDPNGGPWKTAPWSSWSYPSWQRLAP
jgi:Tol biopolymer transport system component